MPESLSPRTWIAPNWHADFGDTAVEVEHLKEFSLLAMTVMPNATVRLEILEPGLMTVQMQLENESPVEIHSIPALHAPDKRRFAIFLSPGTSAEEEVYADSVNSAVNFVSAWNSNSNPRNVAEDIRQ